MKNEKIGIVMGSKSDWEIMQHTANTLKDLKINFNCNIVSAHRTPDLLFEYASNIKKENIKIIIAGAGGAAHLPGMIASKTHVPVLGVPIPSTILNGQDSLLSIVQMPAGIPVATFAIGKPGAINAAIFACSIFSIYMAKYDKIIKNFRYNQTQKVLKDFIK